MAKFLIGARAASKFSRWHRHRLPASFPASPPRSKVEHQSRRRNSVALRGPHRTRTRRQANTKKKKALCITLLRVHHQIAASVFRSEKGHWPPFIFRENGGVKSFMTTQTSFGPLPHTPLWSSASSRAETQRSQWSMSFRRNGRRSVITPHPTTSFGPAAPHRVRGPHSFRRSRQSTAPCFAPVKCRTGAPNGSTAHTSLFDERPTKPDFERRDRLGCRPKSMSAGHRPLVQRRVRGCRAPRAPRCHCRSTSRRRSRRAAPRMARTVALTPSAVETGDDFHDARHQWRRNGGWLPAQRIIGIVDERTAHRRCARRPCPRPPKRHAYAAFCRRPPLLPAGGASTLLLPDWVLDHAGSWPSSPQ